MKIFITKKIEAKLHEKHPEKWIPLYSQVTFSHIPYSKAIAQGKKQDLIMKILKEPLFMKFGILKKLKIKYFLNYEVWNSNFTFLRFFGSAIANFTKKKQTPCRARRHLQNESFLH